MTDKHKAMLIMVLTACLWSIGGLFIKLISWNVFLITGGRGILAGTIIAVFMRWRGLPLKFNRFSIGAGIALSSSMFLFTIANKLTTAANAIVLQYTSPIFIVIILAIFFKEKMKKRDLIAIAICMFGMVLFFFDQLSTDGMVGNIVAIIAGIALATMFVMVGKGGDDDATRFSGILIAYTLATIVGFAIGIPGTSIAEITGPEVLYVVILGVFQMGTPYVLYGLASRNCPPLACSLIGMLEPMLNPVWVAIFVGEVPGFFALIGAVIIIGTISWWCIKGD